MVDLGYIAKLQAGVQSENVLRFWGGGSIFFRFPAEFLTFVLAYVTVWLHTNLPL